MPRAIYRCLGPVPGMRRRKGWPASKTCKEKKKKKHMYNIYLADPSACRHPWCLVTWRSFGPRLSFIAGVLAAAL